jgi:hypothetical protein
MCIQSSRENKLKHVMETKTEPDPIKTPEMNKSNMNFETLPIPFFYALCPKYFSLNSLIIL